MKASEFSDFFPDKKPSKYGNKKTLYAGVVYDSKAEADFAQQLNLLKKASDIKLRVLDVKRQVPYEVVVNGQKICTYYADFVVTYHGRTVIYDVKGVKTAVYRLKKKLVEALHGVKIKEIVKEKY